MHEKIELEIKEKSEKNDHSIAKDQLRTAKRNRKKGSQIGTSTPLAPKERPKTKLQVSPKTINYAARLKKLGKIENAAMIELY